MSPGEAMKSEHSSFAFWMTWHMMLNVHTCHLGGEKSALFLFQSHSSRPKPRVSCVTALPGSVYLPSVQGLLSKHTVCVHLFPSSIARRLHPPACSLLLCLLGRRRTDPAGKVLPTSATIFSRYFFRINVQRGPVWRGVGGNVF